MAKTPPSQTQYGHASKSYAAQAKTPDDPRGIEAKALLKIAKILQDVHSNWDAKNLKKLEEALKLNRQIWILFFEHAHNPPDDSRPATLGTNVINLANFVFKRSLEIMAAPERDKLNVLISINREIASGLMTKFTPT